MLQRTTVAVQTLQLSGDGSTPLLLAWVTPLGVGQPLPNVAVELWRSNTSRNAPPTVVARNTTDENGLATFVDPGAGTLSVVVQHDEQWVLAGDVVISPSSPTIAPQAALYVAHPLVRPGASVAVWGFVWQPTGGSGMRVPPLNGGKLLVAVANGFQSGAQAQPGPYASSAVGGVQGGKVNVSVDVDPVTGMFLVLCLVDVIILGSWLVVWVWVVDARVCLVYIVVYIVVYIPEYMYFVSSCPKNSHHSEACHSTPTTGLFNTTLLVPADALPGPDTLQLLLVNASAPATVRTTTLASTPLVVADPRPPTVDMKVWLWHWFVLSMVLAL